MSGFTEEKPQTKSGPGQGFKKPFIRNDVQQHETESKPQNRNVRVNKA
jgi:hypothetical protein